MLVLVALAGGALSISSALRWSPDGWRWLTLASGAGFLLTAAAAGALAFRRAIEIHETHLQAGRRAIPWNRIRAVDQTRWAAPLAVRLTLESGERFTLVYAGEPDRCASLLRQIRRYSRSALLEGIPYRRSWGEPSAAAADAPPPRYPLLCPDDEREVERMFERLKSEGRPDEHAPDEKIGEK
jgi:hypothetical protein